MCCAELRIEKLKLAPNAEELLRGVKERAEPAATTAATAPSTATLSGDDLKGRNENGPGVAIDNVPFGKQDAVAAPSASRV
jgi:hypothetical protein